MAKAKLYNHVKQVLEDNIAARNSDKELIWEVAKKLGKVGFTNRLSKDAFKSMPSFESITRVRRKLQERYPHLCADPIVESERRTKEMMKGNHIYTENVNY